MRRRLLLSLVTLVFLVAAKQRAVHVPHRLLPPVDAYTASNASDVATRHLALDLTVDFDTRRLSGSATLTIENMTRANQLVLDTLGMTVSSVTVDGTAAQWSFGTARPETVPLIIPIQPASRTVTIQYTTMANAPGLFWNTAEQSYGRKEPYLYSLNEPTHARGWIPIQDTPSMRMTWQAKLRVPPQLMALMSAEDNPRSTHAGGVYSFHMSKTMPAYLIALAVGRLEFHEFDERTGVYAEPELMSDAKFELTWLPDMVDAAERIIGPYPFTRYDLLLMPPTFVAGGMEHTNLNFINPFSVVSGNHPSEPQPKNLIAHELAHSWSGDKVTLANWNDVWLNEGITSYLTLRIMEEMVGVERVELTYFLDRQFYASWSAALKDPADSILHHDNGFGSTAYTKGELFIRTLEDRLGRPTLDAFLHRWFDQFAYRWVDDQMFLSTIAVFAAGRDDLRLHEWIYEPGLPSNVTAPTSSAIFTRALNRAQAFNNGTPIAQLQPSTWTETDLEQFLAVVPTGPLRARMAEVDAAFGLSLRVTPPLSWMVNAAHASYTPARPAIERVLLRGGPNSWITQLYAALRFTPANLTFAKNVFAKARKRYHPGVEANVEQLLNSANSTLRDAA